MGSPGPAVTIGFFDGVHRGHQVLVRRTVDWATAQSVAAIALTFDVHPREIFRNTGPLRYLTPLPQKIRLLQAAGLDQVGALPFNLPFAALTGDEFVRQYLREQLHARHVVVGADFAFGRARAWDASALQQLGSEYGFTVDIVSEIEDADGPIRSTAIRHALQAGQVQTAAHLLGRLFTVTGGVVEGQQMGRTLGFPTANLRLDPRQLFPGDGVYAVAAVTGSGRWKGVLNIGMRPTVQGTERTIEVHLLDFAGDLYGQEVTVAFLERLRPEQKFSQVEGLRAAIAQDVERARQIPLPAAGP